METVVDLEPEAYRIAQERAAAQGVTLGKVLGDALLGHHAGSPQGEARFEVDEQGFPQIHLGRPITSEEIKAMIAEDETWEITRGDPHHPFHKPTATLTRDDQGFPQIDIGRPITLEEVEAAVEEE